MTLTPAHRDVVTIADDVVAGVERLGGRTTEFIREYLRAKTNPQRAARDIALALADQINEVKARWLIFDDCHEVAGIDVPNTVLATVLSRFGGRVLLTSRIRPEWLTHRRVVYGEVEEIDRDDLAMTNRETDAILGSRSRSCGASQAG